MSSPAIGFFVIGGSPIGGTPQFPFQIQPNQEQVMTCLAGFLSTILGGIPVVDAQDNRVAEPAADDFVMMTPIRITRLMAQDVDDWGDVAFTASIAGNLMTVTSIQVGGPEAGVPISVGQQVFGTGVLAALIPNLTISSQSSGSLGGTGVYLVNGTLTIPSQTLAAGVSTLGSPVQYAIQLDVHGSHSADNVSIIEAVFRDNFAYQAFADQTAAQGLPLNAVTPLYADESKQVPFINDQNQYENRWIIEANLEVNQTVIVPLQFFTAAKVTLDNVDALYPP